EPDAAADHGATCGEQAHHRQCGHRLAAPGLADEPERLPGEQGEVDTVDGAHHGVPERDVRAQVVDLEEWLASRRHGSRCTERGVVGHRLCSLTSNASRSASPMKLKAIATRMIAMPGG